MPNFDEANINPRPTYDRAAAITYSSVCDHWSVETTIGNQSLNLLLDTGSSDFWVYSQHVEDPGNHTLYDYTKSSTYRQVYQTDPSTNKNVRPTFDISYAFEGSNVKGFMVNDVSLCGPNIEKHTKRLQEISIGGMPPLAVTIGVATNVTKNIKDLPCWDGVIGLGFIDQNKGDYYGLTRRSYIRR
ncbi:MAG: hypothetical protein Q9213_002391 [Squamulea squamosa]